MKGALKDVAGITDLKTDVKTKSATFNVEPGFDYVAKLDEIGKGNEHVKGWSKAD